MGYTHFDKISVINGLAYGVKGSEVDVMDSLGRMYLNFEPGSQFYVDGTNGASGNDGLTWDTAVDDITAALALCTANKGDVIWVAPWHTETLSDAGELVFNKAGVTVIGLGSGSLRPTITLDTATDADIDITADNTTIKNFRFEADFEDIAVCIDLDAENCTLEDCEFLDAESGHNFVVYIDADDTDNACDGLTVRGCTAISADTANDHFIAAAGDIDRLTIENCYVNLGVNAGEAIIEAETGKDFTNCIIRNNTLIRLNTSGALAMESDTSANSGVIADNYIGHDDSDAADPFDVTGARLFNNYAVGVDDASGLLLPAEDDDA
jgi:hypothetical protein